MHDLYGILTFVFFLLKLFCKLAYPFVCCFVLCLLSSFAMITLIGVIKWRSENWFASRKRWCKCL